MFLAVAAVFGYRFTESGKRPSQSFSQFVHDVNAKQVRRVIVDGDTLITERTDGSTVETVAPHGYVAANPTFVTGLTSQGIQPST